MQLMKRAKQQSPRTRRSGWDKPIRETQRRHTGSSLRCYKMTTLIYRRVAGHNPRADSGKSVSRGLRETPKGSMGQARGAPLSNLCLCHEDAQDDQRAVCINLPALWAERESTVGGKNVSISLIKEMQNIFLSITSVITFTDTRAGSPRTFSRA